MVQYFKKYLLRIQSYIFIVFFCVFGIYLFFDHARSNSDLVYASDLDGIISREKDLLSKDIYTNPDFFPLLDLEKVRDKLDRLMVSLQQLSTQYTERDNKRDSLNNEYDDVLLTLEYITSDMQNKKDDVKNILAKLSVSKKKIADLKQSIIVLKDDILSSKSNLSQYTLFLYTINNNIYGEDVRISDIKLLANSDNIAESLSKSDLVHMLSMKLKDLLSVLQGKQRKYTKQVMELNEMQQKYKKLALSLKREIEDLEDKKERFHELLGYLQMSKENADRKIGMLRKSREDLENQMSMLRGVANYNGESAYSGSKAHELLQMDDREHGGKYFSWPIIPAQGIKYHYRDNRYLQKYGKQLNGIMIHASQGDDVYAPAPGIVYKIHRPASIELGRLIVMHKYGYISFYYPLSDIFVSPGDVVKRGQVIARVGGKAGTMGSGLGSKDPHLVFEVLQNDDSKDPYMLLDISVFDEYEIPSEYRAKYFHDYFSREVDLSVLPSIAGDTVESRRNEWLRTYATGPYRDPEFRKRASHGTNINPLFGICVAFAETSYKNFKSKNNIGNVGNDDSGNTVIYETPLEGARALFYVLNNKYLGGYYTLDELSRFGNKEGHIYASSSYNRQKNIMKCMSALYGYPIQEDFPFRSSR